MGTPEQGDEFLGARWPDVPAISDPARTLFRAFDLGRASMKQIFGLRVWKELAKALRFGVGMPAGDTLALGGTFLVQGRRLIAADVAEHTGHVPPFEELAEMARERSSAFGTGPLASSVGPSGA